jgi:protease I
VKALIISADNFEDSELLVPYYRFKEAGIEVGLP